MHNVCMEEIICTHPHTGAKTCRACYSSMRTANKQTAEDVYERRVIRQEGCWDWNGWKDGHGYAAIEVGGRNRIKIKAHRFSYERAYGPAPEGYDIDHLCRNPSCTRPDHLEAVTHAENCRRGAHGMLITHCPQGHEYTPENTWYDKGSRVCRQCKVERSRVYYHTVAKYRERPRGTV